jgi:type II secretory pathway component GspD/PulD (secretin)
MLQSLRSLPVVIGLLFAIPSCTAPVTGTTESAPASLDSQTGATPDAFAPQGGQGGQDETLQAQRARLLVNRYIEQARRLRADGKLEEARLELLRAKDLMPQNQEVLSLLAQIGSELGEGAGLAQTVAEEQQRLAMVREERLRAEVVRHLEEAERAIGQGNHAAAIQNLRTALLHMDVGAHVEWGSLQAQAREMLARAEEARDEADRRESDRRSAEALQQIRAAEEMERARRQAKVDRLIDTSMRAFIRKNFELSRNLAFEAIQEDPTNQTAQQLHSAAIKAVRESHNDNYYREKAREIARMQESFEELKIPQTDLVRVDPAVWSRASARRVAAVPTAAVSPDDAAVLERVNTETLEKLSFTEETGDYREVTKVLQTITNIPIFITPEGKAVIDGENLRLVLELGAPITVANLLTHMTSKSENLAWTVRNGVVEITTKAAAGGENLVHLHDIRDLVFPITDFIPPTVRDIPVGEASGTRTGSVAEESPSYVQPETLVQNIKEATGTAYWETAGVSLEPTENGYLLVTANPEMQQRVGQFLADQRRFMTSVVSIESKFLTISQNFLQEIGVDFRGLGGSGAKGTVAQLDDVTNQLDDNASRGFDNAGTADEAGHPTTGAFFNDGGDGDVRARTENFFGDPLARALSSRGGATAALTILDDLELQALIRLVEKREDVQLVNSQLLTVMNTQRANVAVLNQTSYVKDYDVEVAQASFIADPKVDVIQDGLVLDVRPTINHDRKHITLNLQPTVAELLVPIPTFTTSLAGSTLPVTLQLPTMTVKQYATTVTVPDGGSVLIGGLREVLTTERRAEVPIVGRLPLISFLFKQEGVADESSSLMVLVRARITDVHEVMENK